MKNAVVFSKIFPSRISECKRKAKEVNICQKGNKISPPVWGSTEQSILNMQPSMPREKPLLLLPCRNVLVQETFHGLLSVLYFHSLQVLLEGRKPKSVFWVIVVWLLESSKGEARESHSLARVVDVKFWFFSAEEECSTHLVCCCVHTSSSQPGTPSVWSFPWGSAECGEGFLSYTQGEPEPALLF